MLEVIYPTGGNLLSFKFLICWSLPHMSRECGGTPTPGNTSSSTIPRSDAGLSQNRAERELQNWRKSDQVDIELTYFGPSARRRRGCGNALYLLGCGNGPGGHGSSKTSGDRYLGVLWPRTSRRRPLRRHMMSSRQRSTPCCGYQRPVLSRYWSGIKSDLIF